MRAKDVTAVAASALALLIAGCGGAAPGPTLRTLDTSGTGCAGTARVAWIEIAGFGEQLAVFPKGFTARFTPSLEVLDQSGAVVLREGDAITGTCGGAPDGGLLIGWQP